MDLPESIQFLLVGILYPLWLVAGLCDYLCHRRTDIATTSGTTESWLHIAEFGSLAIAILIASLLVVTRTTVIAIGLAIVAHTVLSFIDVAYTQGRRHISPFEQHVHGFLDVIPVAALGLIAALNWPAIQNSSWTIEARGDLPTFGTSVLIGSYFVLAGVPILEELLRTQRHSRVGTKKAVS
ncbi:MAG TPA: hypothetical protein VK629_15820 [Steroidobacteraceae bacterium]|nr:hypothetical protein [Steroidobacteraceae bacterium]